MRRKPQTFNAAMLMTALVGLVISSDDDIAADDASYLENHNARSGSPAGLGQAPEAGGIQSCHLDHLPPPAAGRIGAKTLRAGKRRQRMTHG